MGTWFSGHTSPSPPQANVQISGLLRTCLSAPHPSHPLSGALRGVTPVAYRGFIACSPTLRGLGQVDDGWARWVFFFYLVEETGRAEGAPRVRASWRAGERADHTRCPLSSTAPRKDQEDIAPSHYTHTTRLHTVRPNVC